MVQAEKPASPVGRTPLATAPRLAALGGYAGFFLPLERFGDSVTCMGFNPRLAGLFFSSGLWYNVLRFWVLSQKQKSYVKQESQYETIISCICACVHDVYGGVWA